MIALAYRRGTLILSVTLVLLGVGVVGRTVAAGVGGGLGVLVGALMVVGGILRLRLARS